MRLKPRTLPGKPLVLSARELAEAKRKLDQFVHKVERAQRSAAKSKLVFDRCANRG